jgi:hypothetical protein
MTARIDQLRTELAIEEQRAKAAQAAAHRAGLLAVSIAREIARLPCDVDRTRDELVVHLGFVHRTHVHPQWSIQRLRAIHRQRITGPARSITKGSR